MSYIKHHLKPSIKSKFANDYEIGCCYFCNTRYEGEHCCQKYVKNSRLNIYLSLNSTASSTIREHFNHCPLCTAIVRNNPNGYYCICCQWYQYHFE